MKFNDDITMSIAAAVSNVLEGKAPEEKKEEVKYPHDMFHPKTGEKEVAKDEAGHKALAAKGYTHDKPKMESPDQPKAKGEKEFKKMHDDNVEVSGEAPDGKVTKAKKGSYYTEEVEDLNEALNERKLLKVAKDLEKAIKKTGSLVRQITQHEELEMSGEAYGEIGSGQEMMDYGIRYLESDIKDYFKNESVEEVTISISEKLNKSGKATLDIDYIGGKDLTKKLEKKFKVKIKQTGSSTADITGDRKNIINLLKSDAYLMDEDEIEDTFSELKESVEDKEFDEESEKQKKYQAFFNKALKKFGVSSPAELEGDKKKEFFDYIDKNYEATDESVKEDVRDMKNYKDRDRKGHEAYMSIQVVKGNTSNKFDDGFGFSKAEMVMMDKLISKIKNMHVSSFDGGSSGPASLEFYGDEASLKKFIADKNVQKIVKKYKGKVSGPNKA
jgi:hypothetical protein